MGRCWISALCCFAALQFVTADYPEINVHGEDFGWTEGEYTSQSWPRINDSSACRARPPMNKNIIYLLPYRINIDEFKPDTYCHYFVADTQRNDEYEMRIDESRVQMGRCYSHRNGIRTDPNCPIHIVSPNYLVLYCQVGAEKFPTAYLAQLRRDINSRYDKVYSSMLRYPLDSKNVLFLASDPPRFVHVNLNNPPGIFASASGYTAYTYIQQRFPNQEVDRLFMCRMFSKTDGQMCELIYEPQGKPVFREINGTYNQYECLRIRRGLVKYEKSATDTVGLSGDEPFGYIIENFNRNTGKILSQKCYFSPNFRFKYRVSNVYPLWIGSVPDLKNVCNVGLNVAVQPARASERTGSSPCQTTIFPSGAAGAYRIVGMEPNNKPERGTFGLPRLAVYNGVDTNPEFIGDPGDILKENCYTEENRDPTGLAHFGIRALDEDSYLIFCNKAYGSRSDFTAEEQRKGSTMILYTYLPPVKEGPQKREGVLNYKGRGHLQVENASSFLHFLDNRGVMMIPQGDGNIFHFIQMMPCAIFTLDRSEPDSPLFTVKPPNQVPDYVCTKSDVQQIISAMGIDYEKLKRCVKKQCFYEDGQIVEKMGFDPSIYVTRDVLTVSTTISMGKVGCLESNLRLINESGLQTIFTFDSDNVTTPDPMQPCFAPFNQSSSFLIIKLNDNVSCSDPWSFPGEAVTVGPTTTIGVVKEAPLITAAPSGPAPDLDSYYVDTLEGVSVSGIILVACLSVFAAIVGASLIGRRKYIAQHPPDTGLTQTADTSVMMSTQAAPVPTPLASPTPTPPPPEKDLFSKVGDFKSNSPFGAPSPAEPNLFSKVGDFSAVRKP